MTITKKLFLPSIIICAALILVSFAYYFVYKELVEKPTAIQTTKTSNHDFSIYLPNGQSLSSDHQEFAFAISDKPHEASGKLPDGHVSNLKASLVSFDRKQYINLDNNLLREGTRYTATSLTLKENTGYMLYVSFKGKNPESAITLNTSYKQQEAQQIISTQTSQIDEIKMSSSDDISAEILDVPNDGGGISKIESQYGASIAIAFSKGGMDLNNINETLQKAGKAIAVGPNLEYVEMTPYTRPDDKLNIVGFNATFPAPGSYYLYINPNENSDQLLTFILTAK